MLHMGIFYGKLYYNMNNTVIMGGLMWPNDLMGGLWNHGMFHPGNGRVHVLKTLPRWSKYEENMNSGWWFQTSVFFPVHM